MSEFVYKEYLPENAEILIDYTKPPKDRVKFLYVKERTFNQALWHGGLTSFVNFWMTILIFVFVAFCFAVAGWGFGYGIGYIAVHPKIVQLILGLLDNLGRPYTVTSTYPSIVPFFSGMLATLLIVLGVPILALLFAARDKELLSGMIPKMNYNCVKWMGRLKKTTATTGDLFDNKFSIPFFHNVYLDYNAIGDFGKYLERVEVLAIPFKWDWVSPKFKPKKPIRSEYDFRTVFFFSQRPITGQLDIVFY